MFWRDEAEIERDDYYYYLFKKYNCWDMDEIIDIITVEENEKREELELKVM